MSFSLDNPENINTFFNENGYVVIDNIFTKQECNDIFLHCGNLITHQANNFDITKIETYDAASQVLNNYGMITRHPIMTNEFINMRQNENLYRAVNLFINDPTINHDRFLFYRPTTGLLINKMCVDKPEWKTVFNSPGIHLDIDPKIYEEDNLEETEKAREFLTYDDTVHYVSENHIYGKSEGLRLQGLINIINNSEIDGGFTCVPGFHNKFDEWYTEKIYSGFEFTELGRYFFNSKSSIDMKYISNSIRIPMKAGSIVLWDARLAHTGKPNLSNRPRLALPFSVSPIQDMSSERRKNRRKLLDSVLEQNNIINITETGRKIFDL